MFGSRKKASTPMGTPQDTARMHEQARILLIGHKYDSKEIDSFSWSNYPKKLNLADYHIVIFYLCDSDKEKDTFAGISEIADHNYWNLLFNTNSRIFFLGTPASLYTENGPFTSYFSPLLFLGYELQWESNVGEIFQVTDPDFQKYFNGIKKYQFNFKNQGKSFGNAFLRDVSNKVGLDLTKLQLQTRPIATSNYGLPIAATYFWSTNGGDRIGATMHWLPVEQSDEEHLAHFLENVLGIGLPEAVPEWTKKYQLNSMVTAEAELAKVLSDIEEKERLAQSVRQRIVERQKNQHLLYEQGKNLEVAVKSALKELGCRVSEAPDTKTEDIRFIDPLGNDWICEVKGRRGGLKREDIRQLDDWVKGAILESQWSGFGAIFGNFQIQSDLEERRDYLPHNEIQALKRFGYALIETRSLFELLQRNEQGHYDRSAFWQELLKTCTKK